MAQVGNFNASKYSMKIEVRKEDEIVTWASVVIKVPNIYPIKYSAP